MSLRTSHDGESPTAARKYALRLPEEANADQDAEWCEIHLDGSWRRLRLHDYDEIFNRPGLYEQLFADLLKCTSPQRVIGLLADTLRERGVDPATLSVIDVGAGNGMVGDELRRSAVRSVVGVDILTEAALAAERDRPGIYDDYVVADLTALDETEITRLTRRAPNCLVTVAALGFGDIPPEAFATAFNMVQSSGWVAFNIKDAFLNRSDASGFARLIQAMADRGYLQIESSRRYVHRRSVSGKELEYVAFVARKLHDLPVPLPADIITLRRRDGRRMALQRNTTAAARPMVRFDGVTKHYGAAPAIAGLDLTVHEGEFIAIVGSSGSGKTTVLKLINRLIEPTDGTVWLDGHRVDQQDVVALRRSIGYVFQQVGLFPHLTIAENIAVVPKLLGWRPVQIAQRVDELLTQVGLPPEQYRLRRPRELSGGQQQRVGFARALAARPQVLLLDEPFGALDPVIRQSLQHELAVLHRQLSLTSVLVTHDMAEALLLADRIAVMSEGKILRIGTPGELLSDPGHPFVEAMLSAPTEQASRISQLSPGSVQLQTSEVSAC